MAPVINELNKWDTETPFTLPEGDGVNVLAVSQQQIIEISYVHCIARNFRQEELFAQFYHLVNFFYPTLVIALKII